MRKYFKLTLGTWRMPASNFAGGESCSVLAAAQVETEEVAEGVSPGFPSIGTPGQCCQTALGEKGRNENTDLYSGHFIKVTTLHWQN